MTPELDQNPPSAPADDQQEYVVEYSRLGIGVTRVPDLLAFRPACNVWETIFRELEAADVAGSWVRLRHRDQHGDQCVSARYWRCSKPPEHPDDRWRCPDPSGDHGEAVVAARYGRAVDVLRRFEEFWSLNRFGALDGDDMWSLALDARDALAAIDAEDTARDAEDTARYGLISISDVIYIRGLGIGDRRRRE